MTLLTNLKNLFSRFGIGDPAHASLGAVGHPDRDWTYLLVGTAVLLLLAVGVSSLTLLVPSEESFAAPITVPSLDRGALRETLEKLRAGEERFEALKRSPPRFVDPSR